MGQNERDCADEAVVIAVIEERARMEARRIIDALDAARRTSRAARLRANGTRERDVIRRTSAPVDPGDTLASERGETSAVAST